MIPQPGLIPRTTFKPLGASVFVTLFFVVCFAAAADDKPAAGKADAAWHSGSTVRLKSLEVNLSRPVNVFRSKGYVWFPCLYRHTNGDVLAFASNYPDIYQKPTTCLASWSKNGGLTWSPSFEGFYGDILLPRPNGDVVWLPYYLYHRPDGVGNAYQVLKHGSQHIRQEPQGLTITGWPRRDKRDPKVPELFGFTFDGDAIPLKDGSYIATLYGSFEGGKRSALGVAKSSDGVHWKYLATVADENSPLDGEDGPSEPSLCRLKDGRIMCVFRTSSYVKYGQAFSSDEGKTWGGTRRMDGPGSVQPSLVTLSDGMVCLSGGRPGLFLWFNAAGDGLSWEQVDLRANHNRAIPEEYIHESENITEKTPFHHYRHETSSYTQTIALDDSNLLVVYDRGPHGGEKIEKISPETNSLWVVRVELKRRK